MKNKKLLLSFLALYSMTAAYAETNVKVNSKLDKIYKNLINDKGVSEKDYGFLEEVLNKRNKELKDLYEQSDYIVKPEYLEWQIFFTGFYDHTERGDNTKANAKYHSDPNYNESGIQGKVMQGTQISKEVDLGIRIPMKEVSRTPLNLEILPPATVNINPAGEISVSLPTIDVPELEVPSFQIVDVSVVNMTVNKVFVPPIEVSGSGNTDKQAILNFGTDTNTYMGSGDDSVYRNAIMTQQELTGGSFDITLDTNNWYSASINGVTAEGKSTTNENYGSLTGSWNNIARPYIMKLVGGNSGQNLKIDNVKISYTGLFDEIKNRFLFFTDSHNKGINDNIWTITKETEITLKGQNTIMYGVQYHGSTTDITAGNSGMINNGTIIADNTPVTGTIPGNRVIFTTIENFPNKNLGNYGNDNRKLYFTNNNLIEIDGVNDIIANFASPANQVVTTGIMGGTIFTNNSTIKINGLGALGIVIQDEGAESVITEFSQSAVLFNSPLQLLGDNSIGFYSKNSAFADNMSLSKLNIIIGSEGNKAGSSGNKAGGDPEFVEGATAVYTDRAEFTVNVSNGAGTATGTHNLLFGAKASESSLIRADGGKINVTGLLEVNNGKYNVGVTAAGLISDAGTTVTRSGEILLDSGAVLKVSSGTNNAAAYVQDGGIFTNKGTILIEGYGTNGVIVNKNLTKGTAINEGAIEKKNNGAAVVLAGGDFSSSGSIITKGGSAGIFSNKDVSANEVVISGQGVTADNGGIAFYTGVTTGSSPTQGHITFRGLNSTVVASTIKNGGLMFYNDYVSVNGIAGSAYGKFTISGPTTIKVENSGTVFGFKSAAPTSDDFTNYLTNTFGGSLSNLNIEMPASGSGTGNLFVLDHAVLDLTSIKNAVDIINSGTSLTITGDSRFALLTDSILNIDNNASIGNAGLPYNLDDKDNLINQVSAVNSLVNITANTYINGTQNEQVLIKQVNKASQAQSAIAVVNAGNIKMSGTDSVSLYSVYGDIKNIGIISISYGATGILGLNNTKIENASSGVINVGNLGIGIAGLSYNLVDSTALGYGNDKVDISNNGLISDMTMAGITSGSQTQPIGIYAENTNMSVIQSDIKVWNTGTIDFTQSSGGIGIYIKGGEVNDTGHIKIGSGSVGTYADKSYITSTGTVDLLAENAVGYYLSNGSTLSGSVNVNVSGQNVNVLNINGGNYTINNIFNVNQTAGSGYILANMNNGVLNTASGIFSLGEDSILLLGINSEVRVDNGTTVNGIGSKNVAIYAKGLSSTGTEAQNSGIINLLDNSAAIYVENGSKAINTAIGVITTGNTSAGMYGVNSGIITNNGIIETGASSQGIYAQNTGTVANNNIIKSTGNNAIGIYAEGNMDVTNTAGAEISLSGNDSIGIFSKYAASSTAVLTNSGTINVGNSTNTINPGLGIYSENTDEKIYNTSTGKISVGTSSIGIYKSGSAAGLGSVEQDGEIIVGDGGIGIYSDGDIVNIHGGSKITLQGGNETAGVYGINGAKIVNGSSNMSIGSGNYGFILNSGASFENNAVMSLGSNEVLVYSDGGSTITNNNKINMSGFESIAVYSVNGETVTNNSIIDGSAGIGNIAVYNKGGVINNSGDLYLGNSDIQSKTNTFMNTYAVGLYGENSSVTNSGDIYAGTGAVAFYSKTDANHSTVSVNKGNIYLPDGAVGLYAEGKNTQIINDNVAIITVAGNESIGMAAVGGALITNRGTINITGTNSYGMYGNAGSKVENYGTINVGGENNIAILLANSSELVNNAEGTINILSGSINGLGLTQTINSLYEIPSIINSGVINVNENFSVNGVEIAIKVDPSTIRSATLPEDAGAKFVSDSVKFNAPTFEVDENNPVVVTPDFTQGTNATTYKLKDVFNPTTPGGGPNTGTVPVVSKSLTWEAIPKINSNGNVDIWMKKIPYDKFTGGLWYEDFGKNLDKKYGVDGISSEALNIFNKIDYISNEADFRHIMASLAGNVYANLNQREEDIARIFENSLDLLQNSKNNTKENVKINVIVGEGKRKEDTDGVVGYDYKATGIQALREVERTYRHTFGYSLGYMHTGFEFNDGNNSEEWVDTVQLGVHNKYKANDWVMKNDLTGRASIHNVDRNIDWPVNGRSEMDGTFETYSLTLDNSLGKEFKIGKNSSVTPYGGLRAMYAVRPSFTESGLEALEVEVMMHGA